MTKPNFIIIPVCVGFFLSFIVGLISSVTFGVILLRALIFAALFGVLGFGIGIVFQRFLLDASDLEGGSEASVNVRQGSVVDLSIGDEPLEEDENGPDFYVRKDISNADHKWQHEHSSMHGEDAVHKVEGGNGSSAATQEQFRPMTFGASAGGVSQENPTGNDDILPEIGDLSMISSSEDERVPSAGMDLPIANGMETSQGRSNAGTSSDSHTIAQAIRTVLARDS